VYRLQIFDAQALQVPLRRLYARMAKNAREVVRVPSGPEIAHGKGMTERVEAHSHARDSKKPPKAFQLVERIPWLRVVPCRVGKANANLCFSSRRKRTLRSSNEIGTMRCLCPLVPDLHKKVIEIEVVPSEFQRLRNAKPGIEKQSHKSVQPEVREGTWFPAKNGIHVGTGESSENLPHCFHRRNTQEVPGMAVFMEPSQVRIDGPTVRVA